MIVDRPLLIHRAEPSIPKTGEIIVTGNIEAALNGLASQVGTPDLIVVVSTTSPRCSAIHFISRFSQRRLRRLVTVSNGGETH